MAVNFSSIGADTQAFNTGFDQAPRYGYRTTRQRITADEKTRARYGYDWDVATAAQRVNRKTDGYTGAGAYRRRRGWARGGSRKRRRRYGGRGAYGAAPLYRGRGGFWSDAVGKGGWLRKGGLDLVGTGLGNIPVVGSGLGSAFGALRKATGIGDYNIASNVLVAGNPTGAMPGTFEAPSFTEITDTGGIIISHREFIGNVYGPATGVGFKTKTYDINPGVETTFPWLSQLAANYEDYSVKQLIFSFKSTVSNFQTTTGVTGTVLSATQHDMYRPGFEDKSEIMQTFGSVSCKATDCQVAGVECDPKKMSGDPIRHIRVAELPTGRDPKEYDWGRFTLALADFPAELANANIGEIWVSYTVELLRPRVFTGQGNAITTARMYMLPQTLQSKPMFTTGVALLLPQEGGAPLLGFAGTTKLWDEGLTPNLFINSQNSLACQVEGSTCAVSTAVIAGCTRFAPVPFVPETQAGSTDLNPFNQKQIGACYAASAWWWQGAYLGTTPGEWPIDPALTLPDGGGTLKITFPAAFSGKLKILYTMQLSSPNASFVGIDANTQGNVTGLYDMISGVTQGTNVTDAAGRKPAVFAENTAVCFRASGSDFIGMKDPDYADGSAFPPYPLPGDDLSQVSEVTFELHVEVKAVTGGVNNHVLIRACLQAGEADGAEAREAPVRMVSLDISEYNASMEDNNGVPTIVNVQTGQRLVQDRASLFGDS